MARPLLIPYPENATIQELKQVSRISSSETATRCTAIQYLDYGQCLMASKSVYQMAWMATKVFATIFTRFKSYRKNLAHNESTLVQ